MADQEKQLLLEALEEKQKQREQEAQLQEKMLQQLKARACWNSWKVGKTPWSHGVYRGPMVFTEPPKKKRKTNLSPARIWGGVSVGVPQKS